MTLPPRSSSGVMRALERDIRPRPHTPEEILSVWMCGYSGRDDTLPTASETKTTCNTDQKILGEALAVVKAAGYRVSKPKTAKHKNRPGPVFEALFSDGTTTRMSTATPTPVKDLDWDRGERLARHAWASRHKAPLDWDSARLAEMAPPIIASRFEQDDRVLAQRNGGGAP